LLSAARFRELLVSAPRVDDKFAEDVRQTRREASLARKNPRLF
jgi:hypothetical protein